MRLLVMARTSMLVGYLKLHRWQQMNSGQLDVAMQLLSNSGVQ